jgi:hypothetical protein
MARRANMYMKVKHGKESKLEFLGAYVATRYSDTGQVRSTKETN